MNKPRLDQGPDYERGFVDGMQHQMQSNVDKAVNRMAQPEQEPVGLIESLKDAQPCCGKYQTCWRACTPRGKFLAQRTWVGLTDEDLDYLCHLAYTGDEEFALAVQAKLRSKNT